MRIDKVRSSVRVATLVFVTALSVNRSFAQYRLHSGDTLEVSVVGMPEMRQRIIVDLDGNISLPIFGMMHTAGLTLPELQDQIRSVATDKLSKRSGQVGREMALASDLDRIAINIAEYRPVYVGGDVVKPGEQMFRPGLTVRQAVALAGGSDLTRATAAVPDKRIAVSDLRSERERIWMESARLQIRLARYRAELGDKSNFDDVTLDWPVPADQLADIYDLERKELQGRNKNYQGEKDFLSNLVKDANGQLDVLHEQQAKDKEGLEADQADLEKTRDLNQRGTVPTVRVTEARRSVLLGATGELQRLYQVSLAENGREENLRKLQKVSEERKLGLLTDIQNANSRLSDVTSRLNAIEQQLAILTSSKMSAPIGVRTAPHISVFHGDDNRVDEDPDLGLVLQPGDLVEVRSSEPDPSGPQHVMNEN